MSLKLQDVYLSFAGRPVVQGVSLELHPGEVVGLLGPNGAGKTTTFNLVTGMLQPDRGDVLLDGHSISELSMPDRSRRRARRVRLLPFDDAPIRSAKGKKGEREQSALYWLAALLAGLRLRAATATVARAAKNED